MMWQTPDDAGAREAAPGEGTWPPAAPSQPFPPQPPYPTYPPYSSYPPYPAPPPPNGGLWPVAGSGGQVQTRRCPQCGMEDYTGQDHCFSCGARLPRPGAIAPVGSPQYPDFAPGGRVAPESLSASQPRRLGKGTGAAVGAGAGLLALLAKFAVLGKVLLPLLSAVLSVGVYAALWGWQFALGVVGLLFVHEMGHVMAIRAKGLPTTLPIFIPLLGAAGFLRRMPQNARDEAEIAIAGPLVGTIGSIACLALYGATTQRFWLVLAFFGFFINLINLIPVSPFDGGRVAAAISKWLWPVGLALMGLALIYTGNLVLLLFLVLGLSQTISRFRAASMSQSYYAIPWLTRTWISLLYFGLAGALLFAFVALQPLIAVSGGGFGQ